MTLSIKQTLTASAVSLVALSGFAEEATNLTRTRVPYSERASRINDSAKASDLIGMSVKNNKDKKLGKVDDLAIDIESGRVGQVVISVGGFVGIGDTHTAVPPGALHRDLVNKMLQLDTDNETLKNAPQFEHSKWTQQSDSNHLWAVYNSYGEAAAFNFVQHDETLAESPRGASQRDKEREWLSRQNLIPVARLSQMHKASHLIGGTVKNVQDEKLGKVENLLIDLPSGRVLAVIISSGGFLGIGDELSAVPPTAFRFTAGRESLQLDVTKDSLSNAPHFKSDQWPDFAQPAVSERMYRAYQLMPYFTTNLVAAPDNTAQNVRDRGDATLTPFDQGTSQSDIDMTAQIRKEIVQDKEMSVNAQNVKIVTKNGQVTLRGPVNTTAEKTSIGEIANRLAQSVNVRNQLEVKVTTSSSK